MPRPTANASRAARTSMPPTSRRPRAGCVPTWPLPTCRIFFPCQAKTSLCALDLGCGTGATAIRLARLGIHVTLLDSSPAMLDIAKRAAQEAGVTDKLATATRRRYPIGELVPRSIVRCNSLPQRPGILRRPGCCVARCGSRLARFIGDTVSACAEPGRRSIQGCYPSRRFGGCGK